MGCFVAECTITEAGRIKLPRQPNPRGRSIPAHISQEDLEVNHAQRKSLTSKVGTTVTALNPKTEQWEQGKVTGTYHRERIGDFDIGLTIDFGASPVEVNQKHVNK